MRKILALLVLRVFILLLSAAYFFTLFKIFLEFGNASFVCVSPFSAICIFNLRMSGGVGRIFRAAFG